MSGTKLSVADFMALKQKRLAEDERYGTIAQKLKNAFWNDQCGHVTERFYERLQDEAIIHGNPVRRSIRSVASAALSARNPVNYFAASITRRLREQGYLQDGGEELGL